MKKSIFFRLFGLGKIPKALHGVLENERIEIADEGIGGWIVTKKYKAPGKRFFYRMRGFTGFLVVTRQRVLAQGFANRLMNIRLDDPKLEAVSMTLSKPGKIEFSFEASTFHPERSGKITLRFSTAKANGFYTFLAENTRIKQGHH